MRVVVVVVKIVVEVERCRRGVGEVRGGEV